MHQGRRLPRAERRLLERDVPSRPETSQDVPGRGMAQHCECVNRHEVGADLARSADLYAGADRHSVSRGRLDCPLTRARDHHRDTA
jgi:hypothetical protein